MGIERVPITERLEALERVTESIENSLPSMENYVTYSLLSEEVYDCINNSSRVEDIDSAADSARTRAEEAHDQAEEAISGVDSLSSEIDSLRNEIASLRDALEAITSSPKD